MHPVKVHLGRYARPVEEIRRRVESVPLTKFTYHRRLFGYFSLTAGVRVAGNQYRPYFVRVRGFAGSEYEALARAEMQLESDGALQPLPWGCR